MKTQNKKTNPKKVNKKKEKKTSETKYNVFSMGALDLTFIIEFTDKDLVKNIDGKKEKVLFEDIKSQKDLEFIKDNKDLINRIKIDSENDSLKQLIVSNKIAKTNKLFEYFPFRSPKFKEQFLENIFKEVTNKNGIFISKKSLDKNNTFSIRFKITHNTQCNLIDYVEEEEKESDMNIKEESPIDGSNNKVEESESDKDDSNEETEAMKKGLIPKFKRRECALRNIYPSCQKYDLMYINITDFRNMDIDFTDEELLELIRFFKNKKTKLFTNFYKPQNSEIVEPPEEENEEDDVNYDEENNDGKKDNNEENEKAAEENENKKEDGENGEKQEEDNDENSAKLSDQKIINMIYSLTDIFFFDEKEALYLFNRHLQSTSEDKNLNDLTKAKVHDYFISLIVGKTKEAEEKIGLFLDELEKFTIVTCTKKSGLSETLDSKLYPKRTVRNLDTINEYKSIVQENKDKYYSIFISLMIGSIPEDNSNIEEEIILSFLNALTIIKKEIECIKNNIEFNPTKFLDYKNLKKELRKNRSKIIKKGKEKGFVLDCCNGEKAKLKEYNALKDKNLKYHFKNETNKKYMIQKGFFDKDGYIMYDKEYRRDLGPQCRVKNNDNKKKNLTKIINDLDNKNKLNDPKEGKITANIRLEEKIPK